MKQKEKYFGATLTPSADVCKLEVQKLVEVYDFKGIKNSCSIHFASELSSHEKMQCW